MNQTDEQIESRLIELLADQNELLKKLANQAPKWPGSILTHATASTPTISIQARSVKPRLTLVPKPATPEPVSMYDRVKNDSRFKAFARRRSTIPAPTMTERLKTARKARSADFKSFSRPRGIWSILKDGPYWSGRLTDKGPEQLMLRKIDGEWTSSPPWTDCVTVSQIPTEQSK